MSRMKRTIMILFLFMMVTTAMAQDDKEVQHHQFKKENLFAGGSLTASFFSGTTVLGVSPYFGYSLNKYVDVAAAFNFNYTSQRDYFEYGDKARQTVYGAGSFVRLFPVNFLFAQAQYEHNFIKVKYLPASNGTYAPYTKNVDANSFLVGAGYTNGRDQDSHSYFYFSILWDIAGVAQSPYVDGLGRSFPVIRAGYNIGLFQGRRGR